MVKGSCRQDCGYSIARDLRGGKLKRVQLSGCAENVRHTSGNIVTVLIFIAGCGKSFLW